VTLRIEYETVGKDDDLAEEAEPDVSRAFNHRSSNSGGYSGVNFWGIVGLLVGLLVPSVKVST
jgi:hypothetical protein